MGSPAPTSTYATSRPRTRRRRFWYGNAALLFIVWDIAMLMKHSFQVGGAALDERTTHCERDVSVRGSSAVNGTEQRAFARENSVMACRIVVASYIRALEARPATVHGTLLPATQTLNCTCVCTACRKVAKPLDLGLCDLRLREGI